MAGLLHTVHHQAQQLTPLESEGTEGNPQNPGASWERQEVERRTLPTPDLAILVPGLPCRWNLRLVRPVLKAPAALREFLGRPRGKWS